MKKWVTRRIALQILILAISIPGIIQLSRDGGKVWLAILVVLFLQVGMSVELLYYLHTTKKERKHK